MKSKINYNILVSKELDDVIKKIGCIEGENNKSILVRSMMYDWVNRNYKTLLGNQLV